jgi:hypothetical protein
MNVIKTQYLRGVELDLNTLPLIIESVSGGINGGCNLYIGSSVPESTITVKNISGDIVTFYNPIQGAVLPFSVIEIISVDAVEKVVALW